MGLTIPHVEPVLLFGGGVLLTGLLLVVSCMWLLCGERPAWLVVPLRRLLLVTPYKGWLAVVTKLGFRQQWDSKVERLLIGDHPIVQIFYLFIMVAGYVLFVFSGFPEIESNPRVAPYHRWTSLIIMSLCLLHYVQLCRSDPGFINDESTAELLSPTFPEERHRTGQFCRTCEITRPGLSKHCPACDGCVAKLDHHCVWIRNCVGLLNWRWFMSFVALHALMCFYGVTLIWNIIQGVIEEKNIKEARFWDGRQYQSVSTSLLIEYVIGHYPILIALAAACTVFGLTLVGFVFLHLYIHWRLKNVTYGLTKGKSAIALTSNISLFEVIYQDILPSQWLEWKLDTYQEDTAGMGGRMAETSYRTTTASIASAGRSTSAAVATGASDENEGFDVANQASRPKRLTSGSRDGPTATANEEVPGRELRRKSQLKQVYRQETSENSPAVEPPITRSRTARYRR